MHLGGTGRRPPAGFPLHCARAGDTPYKHCGAKWGNSLQGRQGQSVVDRLGACFPTLRAQDARRMGHPEGLWLGCGTCFPGSEHTDPGHPFLVPGYGWSCRGWVGGVLFRVSESRVGKTRFVDGKLRSKQLRVFRLRAALARRASLKMTVLREIRASPPGSPLAGCGPGLPGPRKRGTGGTRQLRVLQLTSLRSRMTTLC